MNGVDRCLICGEVIPEGSQVCTACRNKYDIVTGETEEMAQELRDIADVLKITEGTDTNIRKSMESILRIADRLDSTTHRRRIDTEIILRSSRKTGQAESMTPV